jgi:hypothetical protein
MDRNSSHHALPTSNQYYQSSNSAYNAPPFNLHLVPEGSYAASTAFDQHTAANVGEGYHGPPSNQIYHHSSGSNNNYSIPSFENHHHAAPYTVTGFYRQREQARQRRDRWDQYGRTLANIDRFHRSQEWADENSGPHQHF